MTSRDWIDVDEVGDKDWLCIVRLLFEKIFCTDKDQPIISISPVLIVSLLCLCLKRQAAGRWLCCHGDS